MLAACICGICTVVLWKGVVVSVVESVRVRHICVQNSFLRFLFGDSRAGSVLRLFIPLLSLVLHVSGLSYDCGSGTLCVALNLHASSCVGCMVWFQVWRGSLTTGSRSGLDASMGRFGGFFVPSSVKASKYCHQFYLRAVPPCPQGIMLSNYINFIFLFFVPEDRVAEHLVLSATVDENGLI